MKKIAFIFVVIAAVGILILGRPGKPPSIENPFPAGSSAYAPFDEFAKKLVANNEFRRRMGEARDAKAAMDLGFEMSQRGLRQLDDESLVRRLELIPKLVENVDLATCAAMVDPNPRRLRQYSQKVMAAVGKLSNADARAYFELVYQSLDADLKGGTPPSGPAQNNLEQAMRRLAARFSAEEQALLMRVVNFPGTASQESACWMVKTAFAEILAMPAKDQRVLARAFTMPDK